MPLKAQLEYANKEQKKRSDSLQAELDKFKARVTAIEESLAEEDDDDEEMSEELSQ